MTIFTLYDIVFSLGCILGLPIWLANLALFRKRRKTFLERLALSGIPETEKFCGRRPVWIHALSVGEVLSAAPFVNGFVRQFPDQPIVFSASTQTGFETAIQTIKLPTVQYCYFPYDSVFSVKRMINAVNPILMVIVETDIWPGFLNEMHRRRIPVMLVNARLSDRSFNGYRRIRFFSKQVLSLFSKICTQTDRDSFRFRQLGVACDSILTCGNFKFDLTTGDVSEDNIQQIRIMLQIDDRAKVIVAGSTHPGEEEILAQTFARLTSDHDQLCLIVAPRNPDRSESVSRIFASYGFDVQLYTDIKERQTKSQLIIINAIGLLKKLYAVADIAIIGGSLTDFRGHNPLEAAAYAKPIVFGPFMSDFKAIAETLTASGGAIQVQHSAGVYDAISCLLKDEIKSKHMGLNALNVIQDNKGAIDKTLLTVRKYLQR